MCVTFNLKHAPDSINKKNDSIDSYDEILSDDNGKILKAIITSTDELLKQLEQTKSLERLKKLHGKLQSLTSFISTNYVQRMHKDLKFWKSINSKVYLAKKKSILTSFLEGITSQSLCNAFLLFVIVEAIYQ